MPSGAEKELAKVRGEAASCTRCSLYRLGTQTVFGEGPAPAAVMLVGEQPGDQEDVQGRPFVGPAGRMLDKALAAAGIDRARVYVTNAVKHFKNVPRGKRRIHQRPNAGEIDRCGWWLDLELDFVAPRIIVAMGATAARSVTGRPVKIEASRGRQLPYRAGQSLLVTIHPSMLLRLREADVRAREFQRFVADLRTVAQAAPDVCRPAAPASAA